MKDTETLTLTIEITPEDRQAIHYWLLTWHGRTKLAYPDEMGKEADDHDVREFFLEPAMRHELWKARSVYRYEDRVKAVKPGLKKPREGSWDCPESPTKLCWFDEAEDPAMDFCVFCGHPQERK